jgi:hypothetical protein
MTQRSSTRAAPGIATAITHMELASREKYLALREVLWPERIAARSGARHYSRRGVIHICEKEVGKRLLGPLRFSANEASKSHSKNRIHKVMGRILRRILRVLYESIPRIYTK